MDPATIDTTPTRMALAAGMVVAFASRGSVLTAGTAAKPPVRRH